MTGEYLNEYIESMHPSSEKERKKLRKFLLYDKEGPYISKYFWDDPNDVLVVPHFHFNDAPYLY